MGKTVTPPGPTPADPAPDDDAVLARRARDDRAAFGLLYDRYVDAIYRYAYRRTRNHADAEDVTAETFQRALEGIDRFQWRDCPVGHWLAGIAANVLRERARRVQTARLPDTRDDLPTADPPDPDPPALEALVAREAANTLWQAVETLPLEARRALVLRYARELSYAEMAARMGRSEAACKQLVYRALRELRSRLDRTADGTTAPQARGKPSGPDSSGCASSACRRYAR